MKKYQLKAIPTKILYYFNFLLFFVFMFGDIEDIPTFIIFKIVLFIIILIIANILDKYGNKKVLD